MTSLGFPKMFSGTQTVVLKDRDATRSNYKLLLSSNRGELFGDPFYGVATRDKLFMRNSQVTRDLVADELYTSTMIFMPQVDVALNDIAVESDRQNLKATVSYRQKGDFTTDMLDILLTNDGEV